jgi:hypothetical protein
MKPHYIPAQRSIQSVARKSNLDDVRIFSLIRQRNDATDTTNAIFGNSLIEHSVVKSLANKFQKLQKVGE